MQGCRVILLYLVIALCMRQLATQTHVTVVVHYHMVRQFAESMAHSMAAVTAVSRD